ncbi:Transposon Tf2-6 polyprotein [Araneus ventricosus]|uniref:RNA-directed DNA polymerase n=1 Tax=Araneus ventricosus TaxID=182803 RepID=A0A4Y2AKS5_ARAVE|nr:Transposon Tf2-6 polyprotein [Araneus ventricosus]
MAFLGKARKEDLIILARELGEEVTPDLKIIDLRNLIVASTNYEMEFVKELLNTVISQRNEEAEQRKLELEIEERRKREEREFELEKLKPQNESFNSVGSGSSRPKIDFLSMIPKFDQVNNDISLYLILFERQAQAADVPKEFWASHLLSLLPYEIAQLVAREDVGISRDFEKVKSLLLKRYKLTAEKFRQLFSKHYKSPTATWKDFAYEVRNYFHGWISGLDISTFDQLKELIIVDHIKRRVPPEVREHYIDEWSQLNNVEKLTSKLDDYDAVRTKRDFHTSTLRKGAENRAYPTLKQKRYTEQSPKFSENPKPEKKENRSTLTCYGCRKTGYIKAKCPSCTPREKSSSNSITLYTCHASVSPTALLDIRIGDIHGRVCADTGATRSIAGELMFNSLRERGVDFQKIEVTMILADGSQINMEAYTAPVSIDIEGRTVPIEILALPKAKGNRTLLGTDFLEKSGIVLDLKNKSWYFSDKPHHKICFKEDLDVNSLESAGSIIANSCQLREDEGTTLTPEQREKMSYLLEKFDSIFKPGGDPTPHAEHHINTGNSPPVAGPPYRMNPAQRELLKKELDSLLADGIIEECESPYASPVVLVPKPNGSMRLCVDFRKLNATTIADTYPLPRIDDLLTEAKSTAYMSTLDLKSGYHQIKVHEADQDKTAFICLFGTYKYLRMPFGLRNAPATFQRLIDKFRAGLKNDFALSYLDDIIILSETFDQHINDLQIVFERLALFKLHANREKWHFACDRVKYLGHWITANGIEVDQEKVSAIQKIPVPTNVKEAQSFLQTCSWFRSYVPNFANIARPLSNLTKKNVQWSWGPEQQEAFETLRKGLITPPVLKQPDVLTLGEPFRIRTDASSYALGAVLTQGEGPEEHVIEYASRLLIPAERNYSTTEREALAVVWALEKFRGYVESQEIIIASDHQPLKWLMSIKSPSGRLARWALQIQSFNPKIEYTPGKANVLADMLSRPTNLNEDVPCDIFAVSADSPVRKSKDIRQEQLKDEELKKIIDCFENSSKDENFANWTSRGYLMNQGILYRYSPEVETEEAQLVVPFQERERVLQQYHDVPTAGHYGAEGTYNKVASRYYFPGMRKYIAEYVKNCPDCNRYKPSNQKPTGLLRTPVYAQRFETLAIDLFGPLPETSSGKKWIFLVEDTSTKWVELFSLKEATSVNCAKTLVEEVFLRYKLPRRLISDNGPQFISAVMQQTCNFLGIKQDLIPVYHPQANPSERKNGDLKPRPAILVRDEHDSWEEKLPMIRFALNTAKCETTNHTAAFLQFGRELRTTDDVTHDLRALIDNDNFVDEITPYLKRFLV